VGTSSLRRAVQLRAARPDLSIVPVRGNVQTRLARATGATVVRSGVESRPAEGDPRGLLDGVVLAVAGLHRLGLESQVTEVLPLELSLPAAGQGALAIEAVRGSPGHAATAPLDHEATADCVRAERAVLARLSGGCTVPVAAYAVLEGEQLWLRALLGGPDGRGGVELVRAERRGPTLDPESLGRSVGQALLDAGGGTLLEAARSQAQGLPAPKRA
jgi:hydroxymethylbilane synthase